MNDIDLPLMDQIEKKVDDMKNAKNYTYKESDIEKIVTEKSRFKTNPNNFAMKKSSLMKTREMAQSTGDDATVDKINLELNVLEERAQELDQRRTGTLQSIAYINERNRKRNVEEAEKAIMEELRLNGGQKEENPFTRRWSRPKLMNSGKKAKDQVATNAEQLKKMEEERKVAAEQKALEEEEKKKQEELQKKKDKEKARKTEEPSDMFDAHNFDIKIDLGAPPPAQTMTSVTPKLPRATESVAPRRSLNLEDYKKKRGLI